MTRRRRIPNRDETVMTVVVTLSTIFSVGFTTNVGFPFPALLISAGVGAVAGLVGVAFIRWRRHRELHADPDVA